MTVERDYVLGTHDEEVSRLGLQHRVWRPRALDAWRRAGFTTGQSLLDLGSGPGYATIDLAEIVGPSGRIVALERSRRFLDALRASAAQRGIDHIDAFEIDLDDGELPDVQLDGAWVRWVFAFVTRPRDLLQRVRHLLKPGARIVIHEYFDYSTWRLTPRSPEFEQFVSAVMRSWRATGGEPDVGLDLPRWLEELGFEVRDLRPLVEVVTPRDFFWQWPKAFVETGVQRLVDLGEISREFASRVLGAFRTVEAAPHARMVTPAVLEIIAVRR
jgi:SAM-dependent methyltransferase